MKLLPKPQITLLVDAETGRGYRYIPYQILRSAMSEEDWQRKADIEWETKQRMASKREGVGN